MKVFNSESLEAFRINRQLGPAKKLTVGQLRIATVPQIVAPARSSSMKQEWLEPILIPARVQ